MKKRLFAGIIDIIILFGILAALVYVIEGNITKFNPKEVELYFLFIFIYIVFRDVTPFKRSIGKIVIGLHVYSKRTKSYATYNELIKRNLSMLFLNVIDVFILFVKGQRLGDDYAQTVVLPVGNHNKQYNPNAYLKQVDEQLSKSNGVIQSLKLKRILSGIVDIFVLIVILLLLIIIKEGAISKFDMQDISIYSRFFLCYILFLNTGKHTRSIGYRFFSLRLAHQETLSEVNFIKSFTRNVSLLLFNIMEIVIFIIFGFRIGDRMAKTTVIES